METITLDIPRIIDRVIAGEVLDSPLAYEVMSRLISGETDPVLTASLLTALRNRRESAEEIAGFSKAMYDHAELISYQRAEPLVDVVGTGGARFKTFNVSTTTALLLPSLGVSVAKHGNRSNSSPSGSADLLEALGVNITMPPAVAESCLNHCGVTFMFAPVYHPAMKHVVPVRRVLKFRTIFNLLGPLTNPAGVRRQLTGVFSEEYLLPIAHALRQRGHEHAIVVHSDIGADEATNLGTTHVAELRDGEISTYSLTPESFGLSPCNPVEISNLPPEQAALETVRILSGVPSPRADFTAVNAALALRTAGRTEPLPELTAAVKDVLQSGDAVENILSLVKYSGGDLDAVESLIDLV